MNSSKKKFREQFYAANGWRDDLSPAERKEVHVKWNEYNAARRSEEEAKDLREGLELSDRSNSEEKEAIKEAWGIEKKNNPKDFIDRRKQLAKYRDKTLEENEGDLTPRVIVLPTVMPDPDRKMGSLKKRRKKT